MCIKKSIPVIIVLILFSCFIVGFLNFGTIKEINKNIYLQQENLIAVQAFNNYSENFENKILGISSQKELENYLFLPEEINSSPIKNSEVSEIEISAKAAIISDAVTNKILYQKNINEKLPIASLTKLMAALVVLDKTDLNDVVTISAKAAEVEGKKGNLFPGEKITVENLLYILLAHSGNDAAIALAECVGEKIISVEELPANSAFISEPADSNFKTNDSVSKFVKLMNQKANSFGLKNTHFINPSGLDPVENIFNDNDYIKNPIFNELDKNEKGNYSTAYDLAKLVNCAFDEPLIWEILRTQKKSVRSVDKKFVHHLKNTNELLGKLPNIAGGKTGYTEQSGESLILVVGDPIGNHQIISVILNAEDRFSETEKLTNWIFKNYSWE
jgi:D-alanyl-D-alanine carboxypeptidase (penicillin-binding protein 5/6)